MRRFHYPGLTALGFYGVTALPLIGSVGVLRDRQRTRETLCRLPQHDRLEWVALTPATPAPAPLPTP